MIAAMEIKWVGCHSNNFAKGRLGKTPKKIVLHWIVGTLESADATFANGTKRISAHYGIGDNEVHQYVKEEDTAWHSGDGDVNRESIGIEHEGGWLLGDKKTRQKPSEQTHITSAMLVRELCKKWDIPIDKDHIFGHSRVVATACPGSLDIDYIIKLANEGDELCIKLSEDIPTQVEDKYKLKGFDWYSKYWTLDEYFIESISAFEKVKILEKALEKAKNDKEKSDTKLKELSLEFEKYKKDQDEEMSTIEGMVEGLEVRVKGFITQIDKLDQEIGFKAEDIEELKIQLSKKDDEISNLKLKIAGIGGVAPMTFLEKLRFLFGR